MENTNFQTIHQMGTAISNMVKQATGRDDVQNIDMEHITVAQNHHYEEVDISGRVVSFQAGEAGLTFEKLDVQINPVQDLHGYDSPWPGGGGANMFGNYTIVNGYITSAGAIVAQADNRTYIVPISEETTYSIKIVRTNAAGSTSNDDVQIGEFYSDERPTTESGSGTRLRAGGYVNNVYSSTFTTSANAKWLAVKLGNVTKTNIEATVATVQLEKGSSVSANYSPYSNICPITGWTMANVYQSGEHMEDARVFRFPFPSEAGTVYGGTLDVISGDLVVNTAYALLNNPDRWVQTGTGATINFRYDTTFNDRRIYNDSYTGLSCSYMTVDPRFISTQTARWSGSTSYIFGLRWTNGTLEQVKADASEGKIAICYELANPLTYHLTPQEITTLLGQNYIWADTGDIEVKFTNVKEMY